MVFTVVVLVLGVSAFVVTGDGGAKKAVESTDTTVAAAATGQPAVLTPVPPGATVTGDTPCPKTDGTAVRTTKFAKPPPMCITPGRTYTAEVVTSKGRFTITLDAKAAPNTVNNFVVLSRYKYFEGIPFHRIIPNFVVQGGDPTASGTGDPGYKFDDELPKAGSYKEGSLAMANSGPNTNGSQFFIITGQSGVSLPPNYSLFGAVTEGLEIVKSIEAVGTTSGAPTQAVTIASITIKES
jgi:cyclophilin family peptidyl-prolyl cis-trans isomerase